MHPDKKRAIKKPKEPMYDGWPESQYRAEVCRIMLEGCTLDGFRRMQIEENYQYYYGKYVSKKYGNLLTAHEGSEKKSFGQTPFHHMNWDAISPKINLMLGELASQGFDPQLKVKGSKTSAKAKKKFKDTLRYMMIMQQKLRQMAQESNQPVLINNEVPRNTVELNRLVDKHRYATEILMQEALNQALEDCNYQQVRKKYMLDLLLSNEIHGKVENTGEHVFPRRILGKHKITDMSGNDDLLTKKTYDVEAYYSTITELKQLYGISKSKLDEIRKNHSGNKGWAGLKVKGYRNNVWAPFIDTGQNDTSYKVLVLEAEFLCDDLHAEKRTVDSYGNEHYHSYSGKSAKKARVSEKERKNGGKIKKVEIEKRRRVVMIGGYIIVDAGLIKNELRSYRHPCKSVSSYVSVVHNYNDQCSVSLLERMKELQDFKNYTLTVMQTEITKNLGTVMSVDVAKLDPEIYGVGAEAAQNFLQGAKAYGLHIYNSARDEMPLPNSTPLHQTTQQMNTKFKDLIAVAQMVDNEIEKIVGINGARMGIGGDREGKQVNERRHQQSSKTTDTYYQTFYLWEKALFERMVMAIAMNWGNDNSLYESIATDLDIELPENFRPDAEDWKIYVRHFAMDRTQFMQVLRTSYEMGRLDPEQYFRLVTYANENVKNGIDKWLDYLDEKRSEDMQREQARNQAIAAGKAADIQAKGQVEMGVTQMKTQGLKDVAMIKTQGENTRKEQEVNQRDRRDISVRATEIEKRLNKE